MCEVFSSSAPCAFHGVSPRDRCSSEMTSEREREYSIVLFLATLRFEPVGVLCADGCGQSILFVRSVGSALLTACVPFCLRRLSSSIACVPFAILTNHWRSHVPFCVSTGTRSMSALLATLTLAQQDYPAHYLVHPNALYAVGAVVTVSCLLAGRPAQLPECIHPARARQPHVRHGKEIERYVHFGLDGHPEQH